MSNVVTLGGVGGNLSADTAAFQAALNQAGATDGVMIVPPSPSGQPYLVGALNGTVGSEVSVQGMGAKSAISPAVNGGTWWDLCGTTRPEFKDLKIIGAPGYVPNRLFSWLAIQANNPTRGLRFKRVVIEAPSARQHLYASGFVGLSMLDCDWTQTYNGAASSDFSQLTSVIKIGGQNDENVGSAYATVFSGQSAAWLAVLERCRLVDGAGPNSNNSVLTGVTAGQLRVDDCRLLGSGEACVVLWNHSECSLFINTLFESLNGAAEAVKYWFVFGGGLNGTINLIQPFFSIPSQAYIGVAPPVGQDGGIAHLTVLSNNIGGNTIPPKPFVGLTFAQPGAPIISGAWIDGSDIDVQGTPIVTAGHVSNQTVIRRADTVSVPPGASDASLKFPAGYTQPSPPPSGTFWGAKNAGLSLSNGNLTVSNDGRTVHEQVRANVGMGSGKYYWELTTATDVSSVNIMGVQDGNLSTSDGFHVGNGGVGAGLGYSNAGAAFYQSGFSSAGPYSVPGNQTWGFAYDGSTGKLWMRNAVGWMNGNPATPSSNPTFTMTSPGTVVYPAVSLYGPQMNYTANFGASAYAYTPPSGFGNVT